MTKNIVASNAFRTRNVGLHTGNIHVDNSFNYNLVKTIISQTMLVDFLGHLNESTRCVSLKNLGYVNGKSPRFDLMLARTVQGELSEIGLHLPSDYYLSHTEVLVGTYVVTGLGYCSVLSRDKSSRNDFYCTKNISIIQLLCQKHNLPFPSEAVEKYKDRLCITKEEISNNYLNCVKVSFVNGKIKLTSCRVYPRSKATTLMPFFDIGSFSYAVSTLLRRGTFEISFKSKGKVESIFTSLDVDCINRYGSGVRASDIINTLYISGERSILRLFDFKSKNFYQVSLFEITRIKQWVA